MESDEIFKRYADNPAQINMRILDQDEDEKEFCPTVLIEGNERTLTFLADLLRAMAKNPNDYKNSIAPDSSGSIHFVKGSKLGLYIHRLPE